MVEKSEKVLWVREGTGKSGSREHEYIAERFRDQPYGMLGMKGLRVLAVCELCESRIQRLITEEPEQARTQATEENGVWTGKGKSWPTRNNFVVEYSCSALHEGVSLWLVW